MQYRRKLPLVYLGICLASLLLGWVTNWTMFGCNGDMFAAFCIPMWGLAIALFSLPGLVVSLPLAVLMLSLSSSGNDAFETTFLVFGILISLIFYNLLGRFFDKRVQREKLSPITPKSSHTASTTKGAQ